MLIVCDKSKQVIIKVYSESLDVSSYASFTIKPELTFTEIKEFIKLMSENLMGYLDDDEYIALNSTQFFDKSYHLDPDEYDLQDYVTEYSYNDDIFFIDIIDRNEEDEEDAIDINSISEIMNETSCYKIRFIKFGKDINIIISNDEYASIKFPVTVFLELFK